MSQSPFSVIRIDHNGARQFTDMLARRQARTGDYRPFRGKSASEAIEDKEIDGQIGISTDLHGLSPLPLRRKQEFGSFFRPRNTRITQRGLRPQPKPALAKTPRAQRREDRWQSTEDAEFSALGDLCVFARDIIVCASRLYVILARKFAQENKI
jgi:hypothetical protein